MFEAFKKPFKRLKWYLKKRKEPSLFDLNYSSNEDPLGRPFATPKRILEYINLGAKLNETRPMNKAGVDETPILLANSSKNYEAMKVLLKIKWPDIVRLEDLETLSKNCSNKEVHQEIQKQLLRGKKIISDTEERSKRLTEEQKKQEMRVALLKLNYSTATKEDIDQLIKAGADVNANIEGTKNKKGKTTPLCLAIQSGNYDAFYQLLLRGANLTAEGQIELSMPSGQKVYTTMYPRAIAEYYFNLNKSKHEKTNHDRIYKWFHDHANFVRDIEWEKGSLVWKETNHDFILDVGNDEDNPIPIKQNSSPLKNKTLTDSQNYVGKFRTYHFGDYYKQEKQQSNLVSLLGDLTEKSSKKEGGTDKKKGRFIPKGNGIDR